MYSQNNEETVILTVLGHGTPDWKLGMFLDIGAYDGKTFSNTLRLAELGWGGVCIEPSTSILPALRAVHADRPAIEVIPAALTENGGDVAFWDSGGDAVSTCDDAHMQLWSRNANFSKVTVPSISVADFFRDRLDFDFLNLDVEGKNYDIFKLIPWKYLTKLRCVCVEHGGAHNEMAALLLPLGLAQVGINGENIIFGKK
jgi:FkbM family methyltransferase